MTPQVSTDAPPNYCLETDVSILSPLSPLDTHANLACSATNRRQDMWERRDLQLIGVLALREIILALERERSNFGRDDREQELTAGGVCRRNCFTVKVSLSGVQRESRRFW